MFMVSGCNNTAFRDRLSEPRLKAVFDYWTSRQRGIDLPGRGDIDPLDLIPHLPFIFLCDVERPGPRFHFRLAGTELRVLYGRDITGHYLDEVLPAHMRVDAHRAYTDVAEGKAVFYAERVLDFTNHPAYRCRRLLLPLAGNGTTVDMILGVYALAYLEGAAMGAYYRVLDEAEYRIDGEQVGLLETV